MAAAGALRGHSFALSVPGAPRREIEETIRAHAGTISNTVHARVDYLIATPTAIARNTQAVRKARGKFGIAVVTPPFVDEWVRTGAAPDAETYAPTRDTNEMRKPAAGGIVRRDEHMGLRRDGRSIQPSALARASVRCARSPSRLAGERATAAGRLVRR